MHPVSLATTGTSRAGGPKPKRPHKLVLISCLSHACIHAGSQESTVPSSLATSSSLPPFAPPLANAVPQQPTARKRSANRPVIGSNGRAGGQSSVLPGAPGLQHDAAGKAEGLAEQVDPNSGEINSSSRVFCFAIGAASARRHIHHSNLQSASWGHDITTNFRHRIAEVHANFP